MNDFRRGCSHGYTKNCPVLECTHHDNRELYMQLFGKNSNSELAARLHRTDPTAYAAAKATAIEKGLLPRPVVPVCFRDPE